jgi:hypothetical protein
LTAGAGTKNVNVWFKDAWGNTTPTPYSASIVLDITAPANGTITATPGNHQVTLNWDGFTDSGSGIGSYVVKYAAGSVPATCTAGTAVPGYDGSSKTCTHTLINNGMTYGYRVCAIDNAGNMSTGATISATPEPCLLTGTWISSDKPFITMNLTQTGNQIVGSWQNNNTGCVYTGSGAYDSNANTWSISFSTGMDPVNCAPSFTYGGTASNCSSPSFGWSNSYGYGGNRQY